MRQSGYISYVVSAMWKYVLNVMIGALAVVVAIILLQWNASGGSVMQAYNTASNASETYLMQLITQCINKMPFIGDILDWVQSGFQVFRPSGYELFKDFAKTSFLFLTTHYLARLLQLALIKVQCSTLLDRLLCALADLVRVGGLCLLTATVSLIAYDWFSSWLYGLWGDTVVTNSIIFALMIILYIASAFMMGSRRTAFVTKVFSSLLDAALMLCILVYLAIILLALKSPGLTFNMAGGLIITIVILSIAIPYLLRLKLR